MIAPYISRAEYECPHCHKLPPDFIPAPSVDVYPRIYELLFNCFKTWRQLWGKPIPISSGYRCPVRNQEVNGSLGSVHIFGAALDCDFSSVEEVNEAYRLVNGLYPTVLRIGKYTRTGTFIHIDTGYLIFPRVTEDWVQGARWYK